MIIGIGGVSRAGKSVLAEMLKDHFESEGKAVEVFSQDDFVKPKVSIPKVQGVPDWERPSTIKWDTLTKSLQNSTANVKIIEGLFAFYPASLRVMYDVKIFVEIEKELFDSRKSQDSRWADEPDWYPEHVWRSYKKYGQIKGGRDEYLVLNGAVDFDLDKILMLIPE